MSSRRLNIKNESLTLLFSSDINVLNAPNALTDQTDLPRETAQRAPCRRKGFHLGQIDQIDQTDQRRL